MYYLYGMITDNPCNDAITEMNRLDALETEMQHCNCCKEWFDNCEIFEGYFFCPKCINEMKNENN